ncbi:chorismate dehydratase [Alkalihalobacillus xiaoxiensis]|uniref:Chorismate dehydratase n=1 Tax=Shouchella xiaoxiensis TaxID=766895 RepID=A0ABS2SX87_9BACI|nr:menaquinone biosynthesis protein [Shouchella xiaoxiensis]MBM7840154.1 chorismate dehydratase [Shouchella xiaoxiensis]
MGLKVGEIAYSNTIPFFFNLNKQELAKADITFVKDVPAKVNASLTKGEVDIASISSFSYAKNSNKYIVLPDLCVASEGTVHSLLLFSKVPITDLDNSEIALTTSSETTVHLLQVILKRFFNVHASYIDMQPNLHKMLDDHDACLLIGDDAIRARHADVPFVYDLGQLWFEHTGLPMTYALFAVRKDVLESKKNEIIYVQQCLKSSCQETIETNYKEVSQHLSTMNLAGYSFWEMYFNDLLHEANERTKKGLLYFFQLCYEEGFIEHPVLNIEEWQPVGSI